MFPGRGRAESSRWPGRVESSAGAECLWRGYSVQRVRGNLGCAEVPGPGDRLGCDRGRVRLGAEGGGGARGRAPALEASDQGAAVRCARARSVEPRPSNRRAPTAAGQGAAGECGWGSPRPPPRGRCSRPHGSGNRGSSLAPPLLLSPAPLSLLGTKTHPLSFSLPGASRTFLPARPCLRPRLGTVCSSVLAPRSALPRPLHLPDPLSTSAAASLPLLPLARLSPPALQLGLPLPPWSSPSLPSSSP